MRASFVHVLDWPPRSGACRRRPGPGKLRFVVGAVAGEWSPHGDDADVAARQSGADAAPALPGPPAGAPSGLRLGTETGETRGMVAVVTVVGSGSGADPPEHEGLAHLVEHLVYHARDKVGPDAARAAGAARRPAQRGTGLDATQFYEVAPASALTGLLEVAAAIGCHPLAGVDEADFERERAIVENEVNQRNETASTDRWCRGCRRSFSRTGIRTRGHRRKPGQPPAPDPGGRARLRRPELPAPATSSAGDRRGGDDRRPEQGGVAPARLDHRQELRPPRPRRPRAPDPPPCRPPPRPAPPTARIQSAGSRAAYHHGQGRFDQGRGRLQYNAYDLGGGGYDSAIARILTARAAETSVRES